MFAYCNNNPIIRVDESGEFFNTICGALVGGVIAVLFRATDKAGLPIESVGEAFARGAVTGAIAGAGLDICVATAGIGGMIAVGITGAVSGALDTLWENKNIGQQATVREIITNSIVGGGLNVLFGAAGREAKNAVGKTLKEVGKAVVKNFNRSIRSNAGKVVAKKAVQAATTNITYSALQGAAAKVYSLIMLKM